MNLFPFRTFTITSSLSREGNIQLLQACTRRPRFEESNIFIKRDFEPQQKFIGKVNDNGTFSLTSSLIHTQSYAPHIFGEISETHSGTIIFIKMKWMRSTLLILLLATVITLLVSIVFILDGQLLYGLASISFLFLTFFVAVANFNMHVKRSYAMLLDVFDLS